FFCCLPDLCLAAARPAKQVGLLDLHMLFPSEAILGQSQACETDKAVAFTKVSFQSVCTCCVLICYSTLYLYHFSLSRTLTLSCFICGVPSNILRSCAYPLLDSQWILFAIVTSSYPR